MKPTVVIAIIGFVFGAGCSAAIVLLKETPVLMNRFLWDARDSVEEIIAVPGYAIAALIGYDEPFTTGLATGRLILISLTNGLIGAALFASAVLGFRHIRQSLDLSGIAPSLRRGAFRAQAARLAMFGSAAAFFLTIVLLAAPLVIREGVMFRWHQLAWTLVGSAGAALAGLLGSELRTAFYAHPVLVAAFCGLLNALLVGVSISGFLFMKSTIANKGSL